MTDGTDRPEFVPPRLHDVRIFACIGAFDLKCDICESCAARLAYEEGFGGCIDGHL